MCSLQQGFWLQTKPAVITNLLESNQNLWDLANNYFALKLNTVTLHHSAFGLTVQFDLVSILICFTFNFI